MKSLARVLLLPLFATAFTAAPARQPHIWAVIVGVNDYMEYGDEPGGDLRGAENDAVSFRDVLLRRYNVPESQTMLLLSRAATHAAIRSAVTDWLATNAQPADLAIFYFAGHGSQVLDNDGDEVDGLDETICPTDVLRASAANDIRDDDLRAWFGHISAEQVVVILDSCHSGTATRIAGYARARSLRDRPAVGGHRSPTPSPAPSAGAFDFENLVTDTSTSVIEIAAAAADQSAMDASFQQLSDTTARRYYGGAFTTHLVRQLWRAPAGTSYHDVFRAAVVALKTDGFAQNPQLYGTVGNPVFEPRSFTGDVAEKSSGATAAGGLRVTATEDTRVRIDGGTDLGISVGSTVATQSGAVLRIIEAAEHTSTAVLTTGSVHPGDMLELLNTVFPTAALRVHVDGERALFDAVSAAVRDLQPVEVVSGTDAAADLYVVGDAGRGRTDILARDGSLRVRINHPGRRAPVAAAMIATFARDLAVKKLAALDNPAGNFRVTVAIGDTAPTFHAGDTITFRVTSEREGYLTLIDLGTDGTITPLYPQPGYQPLLLKAGQSVELPGAVIPAIYRAALPAGIGLVRAIVTQSPLAIAVDGSALDLDGALRRVLTRSAQPQSWATSLSLYEVRK